MNDMENLIILEYKQKNGKFHHNMVHNNIPQTSPDTDEWESIAYTEKGKARIFCRMMESKLQRRKSLNLSPYTTEQIRKEWKLFCYAFNSIIAHIEITQEKKEFILEHFDDTESLARLGHGSFSEEKENGLPWAWEYDPLNIIESNF